MAPSFAARYGEEMTDRAQSVPRSPVIVMWIRFVLVFGGLMAVFSMADAILRPLINSATATWIGAALRLLGVETTVTGPVVDNPLFPIEIIWDCTGVTPACLFVSAVAAYPAPWRRKLEGVLVGVPAIIAVNTVRIVSLVFLGYHFPAAFETAHVLVWQSLIVLSALLLWLLWVAREIARAAP
jgi:archaeosortase B (VPXXXP-CTERM-specific)